MKTKRLLQGPVERLSHQLARRRTHLDMRREHDSVMRDPQMAVEHVTQSNRALSRGEGGCRLCD
jgi:hypothetical protein